VAKLGQKKGTTEKKIWEPLIYGANGFRITVTPTPRARLFSNTPVIIRIVVARSRQRM
jgi:hypothetical protein